MYYFFSSSVSTRDLHSFPTRRSSDLEEGSRLVVEDRGDAIVFRPVARLEDLGGSLSKTTTLERMLKILDESRKDRSEEHTSELQSPYDLVCRLLLEKKKSRNT